MTPFAFSGAAARALTVRCASCSEREKDTWRASLFAQTTRYALATTHITFRLIRGLQPPPWRDRSSRYRLVPWLRPDLDWRWAVQGHGGSLRTDRALRARSVRCNPPPVRTAGQETQPGVSRWQLIGRLGPVLHGLFRDSAESWQPFAGWQLIGRLGPVLRGLFRDSAESWKELPCIADGRSGSDGSSRAVRIA